MQSYAPCLSCSSPKSYGFGGALGKGSHQLGTLTKFKVRRTPNGHRDGVSATTGLIRRAQARFFIASLPGRASPVPDGSGRAALSQAE